MSTQLVSKSVGVLAGGRQIIYFDESPGLARSDIRDTRELRASAPADGQLAPSGDDAQLRWDPLAGEWVALAAQRQDRTFLPPANLCPLCPSRPGRPTEIPAAGYDVVVFENRFPSLHAAGSPAAGAASAVYRAGQLGAKRPASGRCEVVCFTSDHEASFATLTPRRVRTVVEAAQAREYQRRGGRNLFDDMVTRELAERVRVIARNEHWTAFVPAAARWPFEVMLFPVRVPDIPALDDLASAGFCDLYLDVLRRLDGMSGIRMPYIASWHQAPVGDAFARAEFGLHLQVMAVRRAPGRLKYLAGTEPGMGVWINDVTPEEAARRPRSPRRP